MSWNRFFSCGLGLLVLNSGLALGTQEPCWTNLTVHRDGTLWVRIDYRIFASVRAQHTKDLWVNVQAETLSPTDIVDATISKRDVDNSTTDEMERIELLYNPRNREFTRSSEMPYSIREEGRTGGDLTPKYFLTLSVKRADGTQFKLLESVPVDF